jgi:hypothetical protein
MPTKPRTRGTRTELSILRFLTFNYDQSHKQIQKLALKTKHDTWTRTVCMRLRRRGLIAVREVGERPLRYNITTKGFAHLHNLED